MHDLDDDDDEEYLDDDIEDEEEEDEEVLDGAARQMLGGGPGGSDAGGAGFPAGGEGITIYIPGIGNVPLSSLGALSQQFRGPGRQAPQQEGGEQAWASFKAFPVRRACVRGHGMGGEKGEEARLRRRSQAPDTDGKP